MRTVNTSTHTTFAKSMFVALTGILLGCCDIGSRLFPVSEEAIAEHIRKDIAKHFQEAILELYSEEEVRYLEWKSEILEKLQAESEPLRSGFMNRSFTLRFTYPRESFPNHLPDGAWSMLMTNVEASDRRFIRKPIGHESRTQNQQLKVAQTFARHRNDDAKVIIGELDVLCEVIHERDGHVEYDLIDLRIIGQYDHNTKEWSLVSHSIQPVGSE